MISRTSCNIQRKSNVIYTSPCRWKARWLKNSMNASAHIHSFFTPPPSSQTFRARTQALAKLRTERSPLPFANFAMFFLRFFCATKKKQNARQAERVGGGVEGAGVCVCVSRTASAFNEVCFCGQVRRSTGLVRVDINYTPKKKQHKSTTNVP